MKNVLIGVAVVALVLIAGRRVWRSFLTDEELVQQRFAQMVDGFNDQTMRHALGGFAADYRDESSGAEKPDVRGYLAGMFFRGERVRVEIPEGELVVRFDEQDPSLARVTGRAVFYEERGGTESLWWDANFDAKLVKREGEWYVHRTTKVNHRDRGKN